MKIGKFVEGTFKPLRPETYLSLGAQSIPHQIYEIYVRTTPMTVERSSDVARKLMSINLPGTTILAVDTSEDAVAMQVTGSPFPWASLIAIIPSIIGPILLFIIGVIIAFKIPEWAYAVPVVAAGIAILAYAVLKAKR